MLQNLNTILLIDPDFSRFIGDFSREANKSAGFTVTPFASIDSGLAHMETNEKAIGVVILELSFTPNNYEGIEALRRIKKKYPFLPVIMFIDNESQKNLAQALVCMKEGASSYIVRSTIHLDSLFKMLKIVVSEYQLKTEKERYNILREEHRLKSVSFEKMLYTIEMILRDILKDELMFSPDFEKRIKTFESFYEKLKKKEEKEGFIAEPFKRITDIAGLRLIFYNADDLQRAAGVLIGADDFVDVKHGGNLVADDKSKTLGYRAIHFDLKLNDKKRLFLGEYQILTDIACEVQLKTTFAHSWSKVYHALSYKKIGELNLSPVEQKAFDDNFKEAAQHLEGVEKEITELCSEYYPNTKTIPGMY